NVRGKYAALEAVAAGVLMEMLQMGIILAVAKPFEEAVALVRLIAVPMISINGFGTFIFILIIFIMLFVDFFGGCFFDLFYRYCGVFFLSCEVLNMFGFVLFNV
ncbi:LytS/YhcK type 5TM receptor domain-containing protein, partial [Klebsiella pneumoniae]|uniref:LytS/YhcK type 5TM receptor domain-containing protein n=1 Tax=Klebsiella pneumoniae TaxID=573 RepID=UPI0027308899